MKFWCLNLDVECICMAESIKEGFEVLKETWLEVRVAYSLLKHLSQPWPFLPQKLPQSTQVWWWPFLHCGSAVSSRFSVADSATPRTLALQAPLSMGFSRQEYWSGVPFLSPILASHWAISVVCFYFLFYTRNSLILRHLMFYIYSSASGILCRFRTCFK